MTVAALYVDPRGPYPALLGPEMCWDAERDARAYPGPWPVVAHPPCARWCRLAKLVEAVYGYRVGDDGGTFAAAVTAVQRWGGVLEHPAHSMAWAAHGLPPPIRGGWQRCIDGGWVCEVSQAAYGHRARKLTWLYYVGDAAPDDLDWSSPEWAGVISGLRNNCGRPLSQRVWPKEASATPLAFAELLISIASKVRLRAA